MSDMKMEGRTKANSSKTIVHRGRRDEKLIYPYMY